MTTVTVKSAKGKAQGFNRDEQDHRQVTRITEIKQILVSLIDQTVLNETYNQQLNTEVREISAEAFKHFRDEEVRDLLAQLRVTTTFSWSRHSKLYKMIISTATPDKHILKTFMECQGILDQQETEKNRKKGKKDREYLARFSELKKTLIENYDYDKEKVIELFTTAYNKCIEPYVAQQKLIEKMIANQSDSIKDEYGF